MATQPPDRAQATPGTSQATRDLTAEEAALIAALIAASAAAQARLADATVDQIKRLLSELLDGNGWFFQSRVDAIVDEIVELMADSLESAADLTQGYIEGILDILEIDFDDIELDIDPRTIRNGVTPEREWNRPAEQARISRLLGADEFQANEKALVRAEQQARMDLMLVRQQAEQEMWQVSGDIIAYRRILRPELSQFGPCGLCIVAASRVYKTSELKPLHNGCVCDVFPIVKDGSGQIVDPGFDLNAEDLTSLYEAGGGTNRQGLQRVRLKHLAHGELGPILADGKYKVRSKAEVTDLAAKGLDYQTIYDAQVKQIRAYERAVANGSTPQIDIEFHRRMRDKYAKRLGIDQSDAA